MTQAKWQGTIIAESNSVKFFDNNHYFPVEALRKEFFKLNAKHTTCPWKGIASYYDVIVGGQKNPGAAWYYPDPLLAAAEIKDYVAFWQGIEIVSA